GIPLADDPRGIARLVVGANVMPGMLARGAGNVRGRLQEHIGAVVGLTGRPPESRDWFARDPVPFLSVVVEAAQPDVLSFDHAQNKLMLLRRPDAGEIAAHVLAPLPGFVPRRDLLRVVGEPAPLELDRARRMRLQLVTEPGPHAGHAKADAGEPLVGIIM